MRRDSIAIIVLSAALAGNAATAQPTQGRIPPLPKPIAPAPVASPTEVGKKLPIFRHDDVDLAWQSAQKSRRPVMVFVTSKNCFYCQKMVEETFSHPQIAKANNERFETAILSRDKQPEIVKKLGIRAFPTTLLVNPDGSLQGRLEGFAEPVKFAQQFLLPPKDSVGRAPAAAARTRPGVRSR